MSINWVMLSEDGRIVKLPHEAILHRVSRLQFDLTVPKALQRNDQPPFSIKSPDGEAYITNQRIIYLPASPTTDFKSFAAPILNFEDSYLTSPFFGSWYWAATVTSVQSGGLPVGVPRATVKLTFKEGGHDKFRETFEGLKERLHHLRELQREAGGNDGPFSFPLEPLPAYEAEAGQGNNGPLTQRATPREPPPGYEEAQLQGVQGRLEGEMGGNRN